MKKKGIIGTLLAFVMFFLVVTVFEESLLTGISQALVYEDPLEKVDAIVVLVGGNGNRIETAARLYHAGFGEKLFFSGFKVYPGIYTHDLMQTYALELGVPKNNIVAEYAGEEVEASTRDESHANFKLLKKHAVNKVILLTSEFHTGRAKRIYDQEIKALGFENMEFIVYPAYDPFVPIRGWWKLRTGKKGIFLEYLKSIAYYFNL